MLDTGSKRRCFLPNEVEMVYNIEFQLYHYISVLQKAHLKMEIN